MTLVKRLIPLTEVQEIERSLVNRYKASVRESAMQVIKAASQGLFFKPEDACQYIVKAARFRRDPTPAAFWSLVEDIERELRTEGFEVDNPMTWRPHEANVLEVRATKLPSGARRKP